MKRTVKYLFILLSFLCLLVPFHVLAYDAYHISDYQIHIDISKSAVMSVEENITIKDCRNLEFYKDITQNYSYDADQDGTPETYAYEISNIHVEGAKYSTSHSDGKYRVSFSLNEPDAQIVLHYQVRLRQIKLNRPDSDDAILLLYQFIPADHEGTIDHYSIAMTLPNRPDTAFDVYQIDQNQNRGTSVNATVNDKTVLVTGSEPLAPGMGLMVFASLRNFFFNYSHPITLHLFFTVFSIILVMGVYFGIIYSNRFHKKYVGKNSYPLSDIDAGSLGYIIDGIIDEADIMTILIDWANQNYIHIHNENQTVSIHIIHELPASAKGYEKRLFNLIFTDYTMVTIDELAARRLAKKMKEIENEILLYQERKKTKIIYANHSYSVQMLSALVIGIPLMLISFACVYEEQYLITQAFMPSLITMGIVYINCLPWIWLMKNQYRFSKNTQDVHRILIMLINFICGALLYNFLLAHQTPVVYVAVNFVLTILIACVILFMDHRTLYGRNLYVKLLTLRQFIRHAGTDQLLHHLNEDPYYFEDMLPYAYIFDITDIWGKRFTSIPLQAPPWYFHPNAEAQSVIYWMNGLETALNAIKKSLYRKERTAAKRSAYNASDKTQSE